MKKLILLLLFSLCLSSQVLAMTYPNEPQDFDGVAWGSSAADFSKQSKQIEFVRNLPQESITVYKPVNQSLFLFNKKFDEIHYYFYNGRFFMVRATKHNDNEMSQTLYQTIKSSHGSHTQQNDNIPAKTTTWQWQGDNTFILLKMDYLKQNTTLTFYNKPIYQAWSLSKKNNPDQSGKIRERN